MRGRDPDAQTQIWSMKLATRRFAGGGHRSTAPFNLSRIVRRLIAHIIFGGMFHGLAIVAAADG